MANIATGDVITSLIRCRLRYQRYNQYLKQALNRLTVDDNLEDSTIILSLRKLESYFDYRDKAAIEDVVYVNSSELLDDNSAKSSLFSSIGQLFGDGVISWHRIALVLAMVAALADRALRAGNISRVLHLVCWTEEYFKCRLIDAWICRRKGWPDLVGYAINKEDPFPKSSRSKSKSPERASRSPTRARGSSPKRSPKRSPPRPAPGAAVIAETGDRPTPKAQPIRTREPSPYDKKRIANDLKEIADNLPLNNIIPPKRSPKNSPKTSPPGAKICPPENFYNSPSTVKNLLGNGGQNGQNCGQNGKKSSPRSDDCGKTNPIAAFMEAYGEDVPKIPENYAVPNDKYISEIERACKLATQNSVPPF